MRRAPRTDSNQRDITEALARAGCCVVNLAAVGRGVPDLLVGFRGRNYLLEVKDGSKPPSASRLTDAQRKWHGYWQGQAVVVRSVEDALEAVGLMPRKEGDAS